MTVLDQAYGAAEAEDFHEASLAILRTVGSQVPELCEELVEHPDATRAASGSYVHPNGFEKLLLARFDSGAKLLLHSWTAQSLRDAVAAEHAHNHRWPFSTLVLQGSYRFETFAITGSTGDAYRYQYESPGPRGNYQLRPDGRVGLGLDLTFDLRVGAACFSESSVVHRAVPLELPLRTLFVQGPPDRRRTMVVSTTPALNTGSVALERYSVGHWIHRVEAAIRELSPVEKASS